MNRTDLALLVDHTLLKPEATIADIIALCEEANELQTFSVCVSPPFVLTALENTSLSVAVATVCGFPSGKHETSIKAAEAALSVDQGVNEVDMVIDVGRAVMGDWDYVQREIEAVREATRGIILKVILETAALSDEQIRQACLCAVRANADYVKTSTGFHPAGGAQVNAIKIMSETVAGKLGVKASGGIRTSEFALELVAAGATRLGLSGTRAVLEGVEATDSY